MFDFKFDWQKSLEIGIDVLDNQHKEIFRIARDIEQMLQYKCVNVSTQQLLKIVCDLREFAAYHFYVEESMMERAHYPELREHKEVHKMLSDIIDNIDCPAMAKNPDVELKKLKNDIQDWVFKEILSEDFIMAKKIKDIVSAEEVNQEILEERQLESK